MWANNFQKYNEEPKSILTPDIPTNNGRVNLLGKGDEDTKKRLLMFEKTQVKTSITDYRGALNNIWEESKLSTLYFSAKNIQYIQERLKDEIYKKSNGKFRLLPQNVDDVKVIMRAYYLQYATHDIGNENAELNRLNSLVLAFLVPRLYNESVGYENYIRDQSTLVIPFDRGHQVDRDFKQLEYQPFITKW